MILNKYVPNIKKAVILIFVCFLTGVFGCGQGNRNEHIPVTNNNAGIGSKTINLPKPVYLGKISFEESLNRRFSQRDFTGELLTIHELSQILWAAQGIRVDATTGATRTAPSAGATHPLYAYVVAGNVENLESGIYRYNTDAHTLNFIQPGSYLEELAAIALGQGFIADSPASIILAADFGKTTNRYGDRGRRYVYMEVGHSTQNILLQAVSMEMGAVAIGAFDDDRLQNLLGNKNHIPLMIVPVGK